MITAAKAASVLRFFAGGSGKRHIKRALILTAPAQGYLNRVMMADEASCKLASAEAAALASSVEGATARAMRRNYSFVSGMAGRRAVASYTDLLFDLGHDSWQTLPVPDRLSAAVTLLRPLADLWRRGVFYFLDPRYKVFGACTYDGARIFIYVAGHVNGVLSAIHAQGELCEECLDKGFAQEAVRRWRADPCAAHRDLCGALAHLRIGSASAERMHLLGQSQKAPKSRGVANTAETLGARTYLRSTVQEARIIDGKVQAEVLAGCGMSLAAYNQLSRAFRVDGSRQSKAGRQVRVRTREDVAKKRSLDAYRAFRSEQWVCRGRVGTPAFTNEERRIGAQWALLAADEKTHYEARAAAKENVATTVARDLTVPSIQAASSILGPHRTSQLSRQLFVKAFDEIASHPAWAAGLGLCGPSTALTAEHILGANSEKFFFQAAARLLQYDPTIQANPGTCIKFRWLRAIRHRSIRQKQSSTRKNSTRNGPVAS